jgi:hypothetical protein
MGVVNELLQNIRFLKFYGWGERLLVISVDTYRTEIILEYHWAAKAQGSRETELRWRVKENTVDTVISFIW